MTFAELEKTVSSLNVEEQAKLLGFLVHLRSRREPDYRREITERRDDKNPKNWVSIEEFERRTGLK